MESELKFSSDFTSAMFERDADVASAEILPVISCILYTNFLTCCTGKSQMGSFLIPFLKQLDVFVWVFFFVMIRLFALLVSIEMDTVKRNQNCWFDYFTLGFLKLRFLIISYQVIKKKNQKRFYFLHIMYCMFQKNEWSRAVVINKMIENVFHSFTLLHTDTTIITN
jgi:hypothetical protein